MTANIKQLVANRTVLFRRDISSAVRRIHVRTEKERSGPPSFTIVKTSERVKPNSVIFYPAGTSHGMFNPTDEVARYIVFELHGKPAKPIYRKRSLWEKVVDPAAWRRKIVEVTGL